TAGQRDPVAGTLRQTPGWQRRRVRTCFASCVLRLLRHRRDPSCCESVPLETLAQLVDQRRNRLVALAFEYGLEVGDQSLAEPEIRLGPRDDLVQAAPRLGKLLRGLHPSLRGRSQHGQKLAQALLVVSSRTSHRSSH